MKFTIDRTKWKNDNSFPSQGTMLLNDHGNMCCLGFCMYQEGFYKNSLRGITSPRRVIPKKESIFRRQYPTHENAISFQDTSITEEAMSINDGIYGNEEERENDLKRLFERHGHEIEFIN